MQFYNYQGNVSFWYLKWFFYLNRCIHLRMYYCTPDGIKWTIVWTWHFEIELLQCNYLQTDSKYAVHEGLAFIGIFSSTPSFFFSCSAFNNFGLVNQHVRPGTMVRINPDIPELTQNKSSWQLFKKQTSRKWQVTGRNVLVLCHIQFELSIPILIILKPGEISQTIK